MRSIHFLWGLILLFEVWTGINLNFEDCSMLCVPLKRGPIPFLWGLILLFEVWKGINLNFEDCSMLCVPLKRGPIPFLWGLILLFEVWKGINLNFEDCSMLGVPLKRGLFLFNNVWSYFLRFSQNVAAICNPNLKKKTSTSKHFSSVYFNPI